VPCFYSTYKAPLSHVAYFAAHISLADTVVCSSDEISSETNITNLCCFV